MNRSRRAPLEHEEPTGLALVTTTNENGSHGAIQIGAPATAAILSSANVSGSSLATVPSARATTKNEPSADVATTDARPIVMFTTETGWS